MSGMVERGGKGLWLAHLLSDLSRYCCIDSGAAGYRLAAIATVAG